ncbi:MAG: hypothetical protein QOJ99_6021 [Bryobacterales bacterium]|jgi:hypothetical protein|nr:hypothetical protein [Bryobacterales bacterium]
MAKRRRQPAGEPEIRDADNMVGVEVGQKQGCNLTQGNMELP